MHNREKAGKGWLTFGATIIGNLRMRETTQQANAKEANTIPCSVLFMISLSGLTAMGPLHHVAGVRMFSAATSVTLLSIDHEIREIHETEKGKRPLSNQSELSHQKAASSSP